VDEILMGIVVQTAAWLESVPEDVLDPDVAVRELEAIAFRLHDLDPDARLELLAFVEREADGATDDSYRAFLQAFPEALGLS
jgi:hypothetical protein